MFALSTAWNAPGASDGAAVAEEVQRLGFSQIELNFSLTAAMVRAIAASARKRQIAVVSLHNYCPIPEELTPQEALPDVYSLSSLNESERNKAVELTKRTIATAQRLSARAVVLHCGRVEIEDHTRTLIALYRAGKSKGEEYREIRNAFARQRKRHAGDFLGQLIKSLEVLSPFAQQQGIVLGLENRFYYREVPSPGEFEIIFKRFPSKNVAYWHDVGHSFILEHLNLIPKDSLLKKFARRLCGIHLHDIRDMQDHWAPGEGVFDFRQLKGVIRKDTIKVIEAHAHSTPQAVQRSGTFLTEALS